MFFGGMDIVDIIVGLMVDSGKGICVQVKGLYIMLEGNKIVLLKGYEV